MPKPNGLSNNLITLPYRLGRTPPAFAGDGLQSPDSLVSYFMAAYSKRGQRVFDPFAGLGTTLFVAEALGRIPYGIEADPLHRDWTAGQLRHWDHILCMDSAQMDKAPLPKMDFCMTCPPYMRRSDRWNPLYAGNPAHAGYASYLRRIGHIFSKLPLVMKRGATVIVQVDNLPGRIYTPLVHDFIHVIERSLTLENEIIVAWKKPAPSAINQTHTHCLVFKNNKK